MKTIPTDPEIIEEILEEIRAGRTLTAVLTKDPKPGYPKRTVWYEWLDSDPDLSERFERAKELGYDAMAERLREVADQGSKDYAVRVNAKDGSEQVVHMPEHVTRSRLIVDTDLKLLERWSPKYRPGMDITSGGDKLVTGDNAALAAKAASLLDLALRRREEAKGAAPDASTDDD